MPRQRLPIKFRLFYKKSYLGQTLWQAAKRYQTARLKPLLKIKKTDNHGILQ